MILIQMRIVKITALFVNIWNSSRSQYYSFNYSLPKVIYSGSPKFVVYAQSEIKVKVLLSYIPN